MSERPPGLIYRRVEPVDERTKRVVEVWDLTQPGCPIINSPWSSGPEIVRAGWARFVSIDLLVDEFEEPPA